MTVVNPDKNGVSDFVSDGSHNVLTYYKADVTFHEVREGTPFRITGKDITIEHFDTDRKRAKRFVDLNLEFPDGARIPQWFRNRVEIERNKQRGR